MHRKQLRCKNNKQKNVKTINKGTDLKDLKSHCVVSFLLVYNAKLSNIII